MIHPSAMIWGNSTIGENTYIGPYSVIGYPATHEYSLPEITLPDGNLKSKGARIGANGAFLSHVVIGEDTTIGANAKCDHHCYIGSHNSIGDDFQIMYGARVYHRVTIGDNVWVAGFVCNDCIIESNTFMLGQLIHRFTDVVPEIPEIAPVIREGAFVGMGATIIGGIEVGKGAYIAAGATLTKSALPGRLYMGTPARDVGKAPSPVKGRDF